MKKLFGIFDKSIFYSAMPYAIIIGALLSVVSCFFSVHMYRDSANVYSFMARALANNNIQDAFHPSIPSLNVLLSWPLTSIGMSPERSLLLIACLFYVLTIISLYYLLKNFLPKNLAGFGALLFAIAPKVIRFSCTSLIDSGKVFFLVTSLLIAYKFIESKFRSFKDAAFLGVMLGGLALVRSEGIGNVASILFCISLFYLYEIIKQKKMQPMLPILTLGMTFLLFIISRMYVMYLHCGKFIYDKRITDGINGIICKITNTIVETTKEAVLPSVTWGEVLQENIRGSYEFYLLFTIIGIILFILAAKWKNTENLFPDKKVPEFIKWNNFYYVFIIVVISNILIFKTPSFAAYRYFLLNIPVLMLFTLTGFYLLWRWCSVWKPTRFVFYILLILMVVIQVNNGMKNVTSKNSRKQFNTGRHIATVLEAEKKTARVWFIDKASIAWYHSGMRRAVQVEVPLPDVASYKDFDYLLCDNEYENLSIIKTRKDLKEITLPSESTVKLFKRIK